MLRRNKDFSYVDMAVRGAAIYMWIGFLICTVVVAWNAIIWGKSNSYESRDAAALMQNFSIVAAIFLVIK
ncbi:hypothetical protein, partial [Pseudomonas helleri]|uniref:hypothetical protein n=1 Tax=Pseudomonas helleri TaxID=1608996 RepID=UPI003FCFEE6A